MHMVAVGMLGVSPDQAFIAKIAMHTTTTPP
jgi:hypothetical protein